MSQAFFTLIHRGEIFCLTSSWALVALGNAACYTNHCSNFSPWHNSSPVCQKQLLLSCYSASCVPLCLRLPSGLVVRAVLSPAWACQSGRCRGTGGPLLAQLMPFGSVYRLMGAGRHLLLHAQLSGRGSVCHHYREPKMPRNTSWYSQQHTTGSVSNWSGVSTRKKCDKHVHSPVKI